MSWLFRDPKLFINTDKFPYQKGDDEVEIDFMVKACVYGAASVLGITAFMEGGWVIIGVWVINNYFRCRK